SDKAREIARRELAAICKALGRTHVADTADLLGGKLVIKVKTSPARDGYDARNEFAGCKPIERAPAAAPRMAPPPPARPAPPTSAAPAAPTSVDATAGDAPAPRTAGWKR
ncbi:MAG: hypothetical protein AB7E70_21605, partial [Hyphomicrobiaceae bacterium]